MEGLGEAGGSNGVELRAAVSSSRTELRVVGTI
jgi:hypothetical protein